MTGLEHPTPSATASTGPAYRTGISSPPRDGVIEMRVESLDRLFDQADPSPLGQQDLSNWAAQYILESLKEMEPVKARTLRIIVTSSSVPSEKSIESAIQSYFARQAMLRGRALRRLLQHGLITLVIGVIFMISFFGVSQTIAWSLGDTIVSTLLREGSLIVGWVAMWRPLEIFLYDWWPIVGERKLLKRLSDLAVTIVEPVDHATTQI